jgi:DNA-binding NtrC family response regulator
MPLLITACALGPNYTRPTVTVPESTRGETRTPVTTSLVEPLFSAVLEHALRSAGGNFTHAAEKVGLTRAQLAYRVKSKRER